MKEAFGAVRLQIQRGLGVQTKTLKQQHYQIIKVSVLPFQSRRSPRLADTARQAGCADAVVDRHWLV